MLEAFKCYSAAIELLLKNIKAYGCFIAMNILFFSAILLLPFTIYFLPTQISTDDAFLIIALIIIGIFTIVNYPMLVLSQNIVDLGEKDESFTIKDLFKVNIPWKTIFAMGIGINFIVNSTLIAIFVFAKVTSSTDVLTAFSTFLLFVVMFASLYSYLYVNKANTMGKFLGFTDILTTIGKYPKLCYSFFGLYMLAALINCYLIYTFVAGMDVMITFILRDQAFNDLQLSFIHAGFSIVLLIIFNTLNLAAKAQLFRTICEKDQQKIIK